MPIQRSDNVLVTTGSTPPRVGVLIPSALTESLEIVLARLVELVQQGEDVVALICGGDVKGCVANPLSLPGVCKHCRYVAQEALIEVAPTVVRFTLRAQREHVRQITTGQCAETELLKSADSTVLTFYRREVTGTNWPPSQSIFKFLRNQYVAHSTAMYAALHRTIKKEGIRRIEFFNGRIIPTRSAMRAARDLGIDYGVIEVSGKARQLFTTLNRSVHDLQFHQESLEDFVNSGKVDAAEGARFFEARRRGEVTDGPSFVRNQRAGALSLHTQKPILAIFTSSADELKVSGAQWFTAASLDPIAFIIELTTALSPHYEIVVRMHPNQRGDKTGAASEMARELGRVAGLTLIRPADVQSTYELIDSAACILTFGSTVGLEATYWGKPSILCGRAVWERLRIAYQAERVDDVKRLLSTVPLPLSRGDSVAAGSYYMRGIGSPSALSTAAPAGFAVNDRSYLPLKRRSVAYWVSRAFDKALRKL